MSYCVGVDIGGTNTAIGLLDEAGRVAAKESIPTLAKEGAEALFDRIAETVRRLLDRCGAPNGAVSLGMGVPGFIDQENGVALNSTNLQWRDVPVAARMRERLGVPVAIDNDVRQYVYGEAMLGAGRGFRHVLGVTVGTGLAAALVSDGKLFYGGGNMAGELGHIPLESIPYACGCGLTGCLETVASATGIARQARDLVAEGRASLLREWFPGEGLPGLTARDVSRAYDEGDAVAIEVLRRTGEQLGRGLAYAVTLYSPDVVIVGGGGAAAGERLLGPVRETMQRLLISDYWERIQVVPAALGDEAGIIGSALNGKAAAGR